MAPLTLDDLWGIFLSKFYLSRLPGDGKREVCTGTAYCSVCFYSYSTRAVPSFMILLGSVSFAVNAEKDGE